MSRLTTTFGTYKDLGSVDVSPFENILYDPLASPIEPAYFDDNLRPTWAPVQDGHWASTGRRREASTLPNADGMAAVGLLGPTPTQSATRGQLDTGSYYGDGNFDPIEQFNTWVSPNEQRILARSGYDETWMTSGIKTRRGLMARIKIGKIQALNDQAMTEYSKNSWGYLSEGAQRLNSTLFNYLFSDPTMLIPIGVGAKVATVSGTALKSANAARMLTLTVAAVEGGVMGNLMGESLEEYNASILHNDSLITEGLHGTEILIGGAIGMGISSLFLKNLGGSLQAKETRRILDDLEASLPDEIAVTVTSRNSNLTPARAAEASTEDLFVHHIREFASTVESGLQSVAAAISSRRVLKQLGVSAEDMYYWVATQKPTADEVRLVLTGLNDEGRAAREVMFTWQRDMNTMVRRRNVLRERLANDGSLTEENINRNFVAEKIRAMFGDNSDEARFLLDPKVMDTAGFKSFREILDFLDTNPSVKEVKERLTYVWKQAADNTKARADSIASQQKAYSKWVDKWLKYLDDVEAWPGEVNRKINSDLYRAAKESVVTLKTELKAVVKASKQAQKDVEALVKEAKALQTESRSAARLTKVQKKLAEAEKALKEANKGVKGIQRKLDAADRQFQNAQRRGAPFGQTTKAMGRKSKSPVLPSPPAETAASRSSKVPRDKPVSEPTTRYTDALKRRDELVELLKDSVMSKGAKAGLNKELKRLEKYLKRGADRIARTGKDAKAPWVELDELEEAILKHQEVRFGTHNTKSNVRSGFKPLEATGKTARERMHEVKTRYSQLVDKTGEGGQLLKAIKDTEDRIEALLAAGETSQAAAAQNRLKTQQAYLVRRLTELERRYGGASASTLTREEVKEAAMRDLFNKPTSGVRPDGTTVTAREGADTFIEQMEANLASGVTSADPHAIGAFLDAIPRLNKLYKNMRWLSTRLGVAGTGAEKTMNHALPIINMLARMVDTAGIRVVDDLGKKASVMFSATEFSRQAKAQVETFIRMVMDNPKAVKSRPQLMNDLRTHRLNGTSFEGSVEFSKELNALLKEWNRILDFTGKVLEESGAIKVKAGEKYIPGGLNIAVLLSDRAKWVRLLTKKFSENARKSNTVNKDVAESAGLKVEPGSRVSALSEADKAVYFSHIEKTMEAKAKDSVVRAIGGVDDDLSHGTRGVDRTERQRFDTGILTDPELAPLFEHSIAVWMDQYARRTMGTGLFNRQLTRRFGKNVTFDDLLDSVYAKYHKNVDNPEDLKHIIKMVKQKHRWVMGTMAEDPTDRLQNGLSMFIADSGTRLARAAFSPAWGIPVGTMEVPMAVLQQGGSTPIQIGRKFVDLLKGLRGHRQRLDMMEGLGIMTDHTRTNFRYLNSYGDGVTGEINLGFTDRFVGHWQHFMNVWKGNVYRPYGPGYGKGATRILAGIDAVAAAGQQLGGMEMATELAIAVTAQAQLQWLKRHSKKMTKMVDLLEKNGEGLAKLDAKERSKAFRVLAREAGFGGDHRLVAELNAAGLLRRDTHEAMLRSMDEMGGVVDLRALAQRAVNGDEAAGQVHLGLGQFIGNRIQEASPSSTAMTTNTGPATTGNILLNFFMSFPRAWYARNIEATARGDNEQLMYLGMYYILEGVHRGTRDVIYKEKTFDDVLDEWNKDPGGKAMDTLVGIPFLGASGTMINNAINSVKGGSSSSMVGSSEIVSGTFGKWLGTLGTVKDALSGESISSEDAADGVRLFSVTGAWWQWAVLKNLGWSAYNK